MQSEKEKKEEEEKKRTKKLRAFKTKSKKEGFHVRIKEEEFAYNQAREISNAYFDHKPRAVAFPRNAKQVLECLTFCKSNNLEVRLRSGGHQHEGMSSADGIFMIRLSDINFVDYEDVQKNEAWIGVGCKLKAVYDELELDGKMIPGGGCFNVNVGGLTQGGGWGMNSRKHGLTCDNILKAEIVLANGDIEIVDKDNKPALFKALRGGGGGNFGIVTRFLFKTQEISTHISTFSIIWKSNKLEEIIPKWLELQPDLTNDITTFLRIQLNFDPNRTKESPKYILRAYGFYHGKSERAKGAEVISEEKDYLEDIATKLLVNLPDMPFDLESKPKKIKGIEYKYKYRAKKTEDNLKFGAAKDPNIEALIETISDSLADLFNYDTSFTPFDKAPDATQGGYSNDNAVKKDSVAAPPTSNCDVPHPHKVSSIFSNKKAYIEAHNITDEEYYKEIGKRVKTHFTDLYETVKPEEVTSYMTFHAFGGKIKTDHKEDTSFAFRDREFLMQFQSWWNYSKEEKKLIAESKSKISRLKDKPYVDWVTKFRAAMSEGDLTEGAFINFVDKFNIDTSIPKNRHNLLKVYYGSKLKELITTKKKYDPDNFFKFEMSIPVKHVKEEGEE
jgi:hypothetical protein